MSRLEYSIENGREFLRSLKTTMPEASSDLEELRRAIRAWDSNNTGMFELTFSNDSLAREYEGALGYDDATLLEVPLSVQDEVKSLVTFVETRLRRLNTILPRIRSLPTDDEFDKWREAKAEKEEQAEKEPVVQQGRHSRNVFVVHGHDHGAKDTVARLLQRLDLNPIVLHEQVNLSRGLIDKFENNTVDVAFAVIILTPDDVGSSKSEGDNLQDRARQNVVFEMGYFFGAVRRNKVCVLVKGKLELPSDIHGIMYVEMDAWGAWRLALASEIDSSGIPVDFNKLKPG